MKKTRHETHAGRLSIRTNESSNKALQEEVTVASEIAV